MEAPFALKFYKKVLEETDNKGVGVTHCGPVGHSQTRSF